MTSDCRFTDFWHFQHNRNFSGRLLALIRFSPNIEKFETPLNPLTRVFRSHSISAVILCEQPQQKHSGLWRTRWSGSDVMRSGDVPRARYDTTHTHTQTLSSLFVHWGCYKWQKMGGIVRLALFGVCASVWALHRNWIAARGGMVGLYNMQ